MIKLILRFATLFLVVALAACSGKKSEHGDISNEEDEWPIMDEFHTIMAESFHPYKDSANIAPAIANAEGMAALAEKWRKSKLPKKVDNAEVKADLASLKSEAVAFVQIAQSGDEAAIGEGITRLHDMFHKLQEAWYGAGEHHSSEHQH